MKRELPILFSGAMVRAILEGRKSQTRRVIKPQPPEDAQIVELHGDDFLVEELRGKLSWFVPDANDLWPCDRKDAIKPRYQVGDRLWIKEPFVIEGVSRIYPNLDKVSVLYKRDGKQCFVRLTEKEFEKYENWTEPHKGKSSLFMFKSLTRHWLEVTNVRAERLQDISREDAKAEGVDGVICTHGYDVCTQGCGIGPKYNFARLWDSINGKTHDWQSNPFVWVYEFKKV